MFNLSVVIPTYKRPSVLSRTLECLERQITSVCFEVVIVNDGPTEDLASIPVGSGKREFWRIVQNATNQGRSITRNNGIKKATGEFILFLDDDIWSVPDLIQLHWDKQKEVGGGVVLGAVPPSNVIPQTIWHNYLDRRYARIHERLIECQLDYTYLFTGNVSIPRIALEQVGQFNESFKTYSLEDSELGLRLQQAGFRFFHIPSAIGYHYYFEDLDSLCKKAYQSGISIAQFIQLHPDEVLRIGGHSFSYSVWRGKEIPKNIAKWLLFGNLFRTTAMALLKIAAYLQIPFICNWIFPWVELSFKASGFRRGNK